MRINNEVMAKIFQSQFGETAVRHFENLTDYTSYVASLPGRIQAARFRYEGEDFIQLSEAFEQTRTIKHDAAIVSLSVLGRVAEKLELPPLFDQPIEGAERGDIAQAIFEHIKYTLDNDQHGIINRICDIKATNKGINAMENGAKACVEQAGIGDVIQDRNTTLDSQEGR